MKILNPDLGLDPDALDQAMEDSLLNALCAVLTVNAPPRSARLAARNHWRCVRIVCEKPPPVVGGAPNGLNYLEVNRLPVTNADSDNIPGVVHVNDPSRGDLSVEKQCR